MATQPEPKRKTAALSEAKLRELIDKQDIHDVMMRYCRAVDRIDLDLLKSCYWPDAIDDHGPFKGSAVELFEVIDAMGAAFGMSQHLICNEYVEIEGDRACCESYFLMPASIDRAGPRVWILGGRYIDIFERRADEWRIHDRTVTFDWETIVPGDEEGFTPNPFTRGERSMEDLVYRKRDAVLRRSGTPQALTEDAGS